VGTTSAAQTVTVTNGGTTPFAINYISFSGMDSWLFSQTSTCGTSLAPGGNCTISVRFEPLYVGPGTKNATLSVNATPGCTKSVTLTGTALAPVVYTVLPASLTFTSPLGVPSAAQAVTVTNTGGSALIINSIGITGTNAGDFGSTNTCPIGGAGLAAGANCKINVTFTPTATGARTASLNVNVAAPAVSQAVALTGTGTAAAFSVLPASLAFSTAVGTTSAAQTVTVTNGGTTPFAINYISFSGMDSWLFTWTSTCGTSLAPGGSCTISVRFAPLYVGPGTKNATVNVNATPGGTKSVTLTGTAL
jgi:hypothetical protein